MTVQLDHHLSRMGGYRQCSECMEYAEVRLRPVVAPYIARHCDETGEPTVQTLDRYMTGVHQRHLSGLPILAVTP